MDVAEAEGGGHAKGKGNGQGDLIAQGAGETGDELACQQGGEDTGNAHDEVARAKEAAAAFYGDGAVGHVHPGGVTQVVEGITPDR